MHIHELEGGDIVKLVSVEAVYTFIPAILDVIGKDFVVVRSGYTNSIPPSQAVCLENGQSLVGPLVRGCEWEYAS